MEEEKDRTLNVRYTVIGSASELAKYIKVCFNRSDTKRYEFIVRFL